MLWPEAALGSVLVVLVLVLEPVDVPVPELEGELVCATTHALASSRIAKTCSKRFIVIISLLS